MPNGLEIVAAAQSIREAAKVLKTRIKEANNAGYSVVMNIHDDKNVMLGTHTGPWKISVSRTVRERVD